MNDQMNLWQNLVVYIVGPMRTAGAHSSKLIINDLILHIIGIFYENFGQCCIYHTSAIIIYSLYNILKVSTFLSEKQSRVLYSVN